MPATVRSTGTGNSAAATSLTFTPTMPLGFVAGDLLIGIAVNSAGTAPTARPSGATLVQFVADGAVCSVDVVRKVAAGGDTFQWTLATARKWAGCVIAVTTGTYDPSTPVQGNVGIGQDATAATTFTTPSSTPTSADALVISAFGAQVQNTWSTSDTSPAMTELVDTTSTGTTPASCGVYRSNSAPAVSSMTRTGTSSVLTANAVMFMMFINPAPPAGIPVLVAAPPRRF